MNKTEFINKAKEIHGDKYDYSMVEYKTCKDKVCIICPEHGLFFKTPDNHLNAKQGCPKCGSKKRWDKRKRSTICDFISKAKEIHKDKYDYSKVEYVNYSTKVCIICPEHGEFWQSPDSHLNGCGCPKCKFEKLSKERIVPYELFLKKANHVHNNKYEYKKDTYKGLLKKITINCPEHGEFEQIARLHLKGCGCPKCSRQYMGREYFIECANKIHNNKYDYSKVEYVNAKTKVCIICHEHGEFWQAPDKHLNGEQGCPLCRESIMEKKVSAILNELNIKYEHNKRNLKWLKLKRNLELDFYLPEYNVAIECQGEQHFMKIDMWGGENSLREIIMRDTLKYKLCEENGIKIEYINYNDNIKEKLFKILEKYGYK